MRRTNCRSIAGRKSEYRSVRWVLALAATSCLGCGGEEAKVVTLATYLEELEFDAPLEEVSHIHLGDYRIPIAVLVERETDHDPAPVWMKLQFSLYAETAPEHSAAVEAALERRQGAIRNAVLEICRSASVDEVLDPRLASVKSRMSEATKSLLGDDRIRALIMGQIQTNFL